MTSKSLDGKYNASDYSSVGSESESEMLADLEKLRTKAGTTTKKTKSTKHPEPASAKKKNLTKNNNASAKSDHNDKKHSTSFSPEELLLVTKAFMKVSSNAKLSTDKKMEKFWEDIHLHYNELVTTSNKINKSNMEYVPVESQNMESLLNCWQRRLQPAVQKFAGIMSRNKPLLGEVVGDNLMDLYYQRMRAVYSAESHTYKKDVPRDFSKCMKAYHFLSVHPKFEVKIPMDGTKPPSKNPNALASEEMLDSGISDKPNMSFVIPLP